MPEVTSRKKIFGGWRDSWSNRGKSQKKFLTHQQKSYEGLLMVWSKFTCRRTAFTKNFFPFLANFPAGPSFRTLNFFSVISEKRLEQSVICAYKALNARKYHKQTCPAFTSHTDVWCWSTSSFAGTKVALELFSPFLKHRASMCLLCGIWIHSICLLCRVHFWCF